MPLRFVSEALGAKVTWTEATRAIDIERQAEPAPPPGAEKVVVAVVPLLVLPQVKLPAPTGTHKVETVTYTYTDTSRVETFATTAENRKVTAAFWYPADANTKYEFRTRHDFKEYQREQ